MTNHIDAVVVGAGPVGLLTAIELALGGVQVLVLERLVAPSQGMKAMSLVPLGSEALQRRGMAAAIICAETESLARMQAFSTQTGADLRGRAAKFSGHFAGLPILKQAQLEPQRRAHAVDQQALEFMLAERARALGIEVRRGSDVTEIKPMTEGVSVTWQTPSGPDQVHCSYLVGCDGGRSRVRKMAGFEFPGTAPTSTFYQVIAEVDRPECLLPIGWRRTSGGVFSYGPFPGRLFMLDFTGPPVNREAAVTQEEIETVLRRVSGQDIRVNRLQSASRWADNTRLANTYRQGRILLAGDAAHVHSPFGGQGLTLGLVDAANLGWKLASVIRGEMPDSLLDTYTAERRPVAEAVLANTLAQVALLRPDPQSGALRDLMATLMQLDDVSQLIGAMMSGLATRYDLEPEHDKVGRLMGNQSIHHDAAVTPLYDLMQDGKGVLLDASAGGKLSKILTARTQSVRCVPVDTGPSTLIRPDACIAWVGDENNTDGFKKTLRRWFNPTL
ncbi:FAD-dependent monooxygenase [Pseudomonas gingeri]